MNFKTSRILLFLIVLVAAVLRLWQLGSIPLSPNWDEVSLGYNAYSILLTGKDEYASFLPPVLRSFDDYKPALYSYLAIPSVAFFDLNTFATRLPSALFGIISVVAVYFLVKELFPKLNPKNKINREALALLSAMFLAISPWAIQFSRVAYEANVGVTLNILTVLFFLKGLKKPYLLMFSAAFAALAIYAYQSEKVFVPLLVLLLVLAYRKDLFAVGKKYIISAAILGFFLLSPMFFYLSTNSGAFLRVTATSVFSYKSEFLPTYNARLVEDSQRGDAIGALLENKRIVYAKKVAEGYLSHFSPNWLFTSGDIQRHHAPNMGNLYFFELPLILLGIYFLIFGNVNKKTKLLIFGWLLLAPLPASITVQVPHSVRTLNFLPTWQILTALGVVYAYQLISNFRFRKIAIGSFLVLAVFNVLFYLNMYFVQLNYFHGYEWQYGWRQAVEYVKEHGGKYDQILITDAEPLEKSYMFFLFYLKYTPSEYQTIGKYSSGGFESHHSFDKYSFRPIDWEKDSLLPDSLFIGKPTEIPESRAIKTIYNPDGTAAIRIAGT
ncbi:MAG: hypothetical protein A2798_01905 [Candidatus Levybacteria bacterium RIFCSPHIGHO2_01_FULL_37_17]|nr:MAG: hypothetical protein A2798_01905 [Candidatus Levybacteria bacterium RIFCSPHIGHO2_01_FULL_37_17]